MTSGIKSDIVGGRSLRARATLKKPTDYVDTIRSDWQHIIAERSVGTWLATLCDWQEEGTYTPPEGVRLREAGGKKLVRSEYLRGCAEHGEEAYFTSTAEQLTMLRAWARKGWETPAVASAAFKVMTPKDVKREYILECKRRGLDPFTLHSIHEEDDDDDADDDDTESEEDSEFEPDGSKSFYPSSPSSSSPSSSSSKSSAESPEYPKSSALDLPAPFLKEDS